jgi:ppGpp synthetase/RelA/SpoT-type nucleotidyltranferase
MTANPTPRLDRLNVLLESAITSEEFKGTGLTWPLLEEICAHHEKAAPDLRRAGTFIADGLQPIAAVHSLKVRIKSPEHLAAKIIRKKLARPELNFDVQSYQAQVTDLVGLRALHLLKDEWRPIHDFVKETWDLHETPIAYVREGDPGPLVEEFTAAGCEVKRHPFGYRSIHYLIEFQQGKKAECLVELQVRTIFEEGWSEVDHRFRYPRRSQDVYLAEFLGILNRLCGSADEMGTFIKTFYRFASEQNEKIKERDRQIEEREAELKKTVSALKISKTERDGLEKQIEAFRKTSQPTAGRPVFATAVPAVTFPTLSSIIGSNLAVTIPSMNSLVGTNSSLLGAMALQERTCGRCGKKYTESPYMATISNQCPDCSTRLF